MGKTIEDRAAWALTQEERVRFAAELKELQKNSALKKIFEKMIMRRIALGDKIDSLDTPDDQVLKLRIERGQIIGFISSWLRAVHEGDRAAKELAKWREFEKKKEQERNPGGGSKILNSPK